MEYANYRGKSFCIRVRYFTVPFPIYIGAILCGVHKIISMIRTPCNIVPINIGIVLRRVHKISPIYRGKPFCVGVRYFTVAFPIYIGTILRRDTQNCSYIYRNTNLISVKVYITKHVLPPLKHSS